MVRSCFTPLYDVSTAHSAAVPPSLPFLSLSFSLFSLFIIYSSISHSPFMLPLYSWVLQLPYTLRPLCSRLPRSTLSSLLLRDRNSRFTAECRRCQTCMCVFVRECVWATETCLIAFPRTLRSAVCEWSFSFRGCLQNACARDADVSLQHGWESCLDCRRGDGAVAALDCDCLLWTLLPPPSPRLLSLTGFGIWLTREQVF